MFSVFFTELVENLTDFNQITLQLHFVNMSKVRLLAVLVLLLGAHVAVAQSPLSTGYYVVVAAYNTTHETLAKKFTDQLTAKGYEAHYGRSQSGKLYLVYVHYNTDRTESLSEMRNTRKQGDFPDAWVRIVNGQVQAHKEESANPEPGTSSIPEKEETPVVSVTPDQPATEKESAVAEVVEPEQPASTVVEEKAVKPALAEKNTQAYFNVVYSTKNTPVDGDVQIIDTERARLIEKAKGNRIVQLPDPKSKSGQLTLTADVFGYRKAQHDINYPLPLADTTLDFVSVGDSALVITFELVRYMRGDRQILYNVYFYNDAAIMLPESKYEANQLLAMMQENPNYRIKLHGHSNGNQHGKILSLGPDKNFFSIEGTVQGQGTGKELSGQRAETIKEYLVTNGISPDRVEIKAWGGRKPIYDKHSANAKKNVRVEVEILAH